MKQDDLFKQNLPQKHFIIPTKVINISIFIICLLMFIGYIAFKSNTLWTKPKLVIMAPIDNIKTKSKVIDVIGYTDPNTTLMINDKKVLIQPTGAFQTTINLNNNINVINIISTTKHKKTNSVKRTIFVEE